MQSDNETVAEIVSEMRERCIDEKHFPSLWPYLDRIEAAHRREVAELRECLKERAMNAIEMTNEQKYKTAEERVNAFHEWCADRQCKSCVFSEMCGDCDERTVGIDVMAHWLALEAEEEKPEPCPFCGGETHLNLGHLVQGKVHIGSTAFRLIACIGRRISRIRIPRFPSTTGFQTP